MSWITVRVGNTFADLRNYSRVAVEVVGSRAFLVGTHKGGKPMALFSVRPECAAEDVAEVIERTIGGGKTLVVLTHELLELENDPHACAVLEENGLGGNRLMRPNTLAGAARA